MYTLHSEEFFSQREIICLNHLTSARKNTFLPTVETSAHWGSTYGVAKQLGLEGC